MFKAHFNDFKRQVSCLIVPKISESIPSQPLHISLLNIPAHLKLADPGFAQPGKIDLLIGAEVFYSLLSVGQIILGKGQTTLQKTRLGWVVSGAIGLHNHQSSVKCNVGLVDIHSQLEKFWEVDKPPMLKPIISKEDQECEKIFAETTKRADDGKFIVHIPFEKSPLELGESKQFAIGRFLALEKRLEKNIKLKEMYIDFMEEYHRIGHMSLTDNSIGESSYFLPHHGVLDESRVTTKLRVVFNGSSKTSSGLSLNDIQFTGPKLQDDLFIILLRFRKHAVVVCADVAKMYRMIWVDPKHRSLQKIIWRSTPCDELGEYTLNTVTYGTRSAPFLAIRCLKQLGLDHAESYPKASEVILRDFYVDDMLSGAQSTDEALTLCRDVSSILETGGMILRKWVSNDSVVLQHYNDAKFDNEHVELGDKDQYKTLGLYWSYRRDLLMFSIDFPLNKSKHTKRSILSDVSKIFDPLGLVSPCVMKAKILMQRLWCEKLDWDESLPLDLDTQWRKLRFQFSALNDLRISRHVISSNPTQVDIHGFADASQQAYGACIYLRSIGEEGDVTVSLLCSKVKVAPLKTLTIPKLELCGALLLVKLVTKVKEAMTLSHSETYLWSDSTVVLGWIGLPPHCLQTFVSLRVAQIQNLSILEEWHHIRSEYNPADILSRGMFPTDILSCNKWWKGPDWLSLNSSEWPSLAISMNNNDLPDLKKTVQSCQVQYVNLFSFRDFSCLTHLKRVIARCLRWKMKIKPEIIIKSYLTVEELDQAMTILIKMAQRESFGNEILDLQKKRHVSNKNLQKLSPFLDETGLLRVGGRLQLSLFSYSKKHPILLSGKHPLTLLLFEMEHKRLLHAGPLLLLSSIRETYWVTGGRNLARKVTHHCIICFRANPKPIQQSMGILPEARVTPSFPFHTTGIDYAGPFLIKHIQGRGAKLMKCYVSLFICFTTKTIHLEAVSDLTIESFIASFRRFASRRGKPKEVFSDNGSNFVGANKDLKQMGDFLKNQSESLIINFENEGISWKFIPANSPNFGGLWEAGVRSCKHHLKRILGKSSLTYEGFSTLLAQIEAVLNSRPLCPLSSSPDDMDILTPSHFLIGRRLTSLPDPDVRDIPMNRLSKFQHIQMLFQHFWSRWSSEYITELQQRCKWTKESANLQVGQLVLIKDDNLAPMHWRLGRVSSIHPGPDNKVRVASIKTQNGELKRSIRKLCPFPGLEPTVP